MTPLENTSQKIDVRFGVDHVYRLRLTRNVFDPDNHTLREVVASTRTPARMLVCVDEGLAAAAPGLCGSIRQYLQHHADTFDAPGEILIVPGGEAAKNDPQHALDIVRAIHDAGICRQSFVLGIGGGAMLDVAGYAAATAHRGVRLIRLPTTTLAQGDAGIGVKNGINAFGKKNFLGTFAVPWAVINDGDFLHTLTDRDWRCGLSEAVKVALVKDAEFYEQIEQSAPRLRSRDDHISASVIARCATLHLRHIVDGGDPFELTEARPLDFGHWAAHKLEQMTNWQLRHGEAVAIGLALDVTYSALAGFLDDADAERIVSCLESLGFAVYDRAMADHGTLLKGLEEFREHLGGELTVQLLEAIGRGMDVHEIDAVRMVAAIERLRRRGEASR